MMESGAFREDLYYRLRVIEVIVPALRDRRDEISTLIDCFVTRYSRKYNRPAPRMSPEITQLLLEYEWPGNIRELENMIKRLVILQDETPVVHEIQRNMQRANVSAVAVTADVPAVAMAGVGVAQPPLSPLAVATPAPAEASAPKPVNGSNTSLADVAKAACMKAERAAIEVTLREVHWNRRKAAQILGVSYKTLLNKIKECGIVRGPI
jgi:DNA-binding NtrC family response regulator